MTYIKPLPQPNSDTKPFWDGCSEHQLRFQKCRDCGHVRWPPSVICPLCYSHNIDWIVACGKGIIYTFVVYHYAYNKAFEDELPYITAIIELEEGPHLLSNIVDCQPDELRCDMPVSIVWEDITEECSLPKFTLSAPCNNP